MRLDVRHLEVLVAIEEARSISGAARVLGIDQPHVTRQLRRIEQRLDAQVFQRSSKGVEPTAAGLQILVLARRALAMIDEVSASRQGRVETTTDLLHVLYYGLPAIAILDDLTTTEPHLRVRFSTTTPRDAYEQLLNSQADVFLGVRLPHVAWPAPGPLATTEVLADPTFVYLAADHPLASREDLQLSDLAHEGWIAGLDPDSWTMVSQECRLVGGFEPVISHTVGEEVAIATLLRRGHGIILGSSVAAPRSGVTGRAYRGSSAARWMQVHRPGRVDRMLITTITELLRRRFTEWSSTSRT